MRVELALIAGLLSSSALAYGNEDWGNSGPKPRTITKVSTKVVVKNHTKTCTVTKPKYITKTRTEVRTVTVTATPENEESPPPEEEEEEEEPAKAAKPAKPEEDEPAKEVKPVEKKPAKAEEKDEEKPAEDEAEPEPVKEEEEPAADEAKPAPKTHIVKATSSKDGKPVFEPAKLMASTGDTVKFEFVSGYHSVARGIFDKPCAPLETGGFFSGFFQPKGDEKPSFSIKVTDSNPIWFYCTAGKHCQAGMVGVINPGPDDDVKDYATAAAKASANVSPKKVNGGITKRKRSFYIR